MFKASTLPVAHWKPLIARVRTGLRLALAGSLALHGVAVAWMLRDQTPLPPELAPLVQVALIEAPPPTASPEPPAQPPPQPLAPPPVPVAVRAPEGRAEPAPKAQHPARPESRETRAEATETSPPEGEPVAVPASPARASVTAPVYQADYLKNPPPPYPRLSRRLREEGEVELRVRVSPAGQPVAVELARSSGSGRLDEAARQAVRDWRFEPARRGGQAVEAWVRVPILFKLEA